MDAELKVWIEKIEANEEFTELEIETVRSHVDRIANKDDQSELEIELLAAWVLLEMTLVEEDKDRVDLSWADVR